MVACILAELAVALTTGAMLVVDLAHPLERATPVISLRPTASLKIVGGTGSLCRILALVARA
jgi:kynurenine formamidase